MMKLTKYLAGLALMSFIIGAYPVHGQNSSRDSLYFYLTLAAKNNPTLLQRFSEYQASLEKIPQVGSLPDPDLTVGFFIQPMELVMGKQAADIKLMQMFPWFGTLKYAKDEMSLMAKAKYQSFREAKFQVFFDVQSTWYDLYRLKQDLQYSEKSLQILKTIERLALVRYRTASDLQGGSSSGTGTMSQNQNQMQNAPASSQGMQAMQSSQATASSSGTGNTSAMQGSSMGGTQGGSGLTDLFRIQIEIGNLENNIELLKNQNATAVAKFNSFLNRPMQSPVAIADTLLPDTLGMPLSAVTDTVLKNNPMLGMLQFERQSLEARKKMVTRMGYPMVGLGIDYSVINKSNMVVSADNGKDMIMPMVSLTLPIYRKKYRAMQNEADILAISTTQNYAAAANALQAEYYQALQLYLDAERRMKLYAEQTVLADKSLEIMVRSYSVAGSSLTDILLVRQETLDYELKLAEAVTDFNTAVAWLRRLMARSEN
jgi:outer membrane protein TolC